MSETAMEEQERTYSGDTRKVRHLQFPYMRTRPNPVDPDGKPLLVGAVARQNDVLNVSDLTKYDLYRGEQAGSFYSDEELALPQPTAAEAGTDLAVMSSEELAEVIQGRNEKGSRLNVGETVALAGDNPDLAERLLEAETIATDDDPRDGVIEGLQRVIENANTGT